MADTIDNLQTQLEVYEDITSELDEQNNNLLDIENSLAKITNSVNKVGKIFGTTLSIGTFAGIAKTLWDIDKSTTKIAVRMGKGVSGARELKSAISDMQVGLGASAKEATNIVNSLAQKSYVGNIKEAAKAAYLFSDATGLSSDATVSLVDDLQKIAKFSEKATAAMFAGITKVQQANGISDKGMSALAGHISQAASNMKAFGKSNEQIKTMAVNSAKLVSSFEKVGISAQTALGWVEKLTNPENIEENIGLYAQLGISMSDALNGSDISEQLQSGMKDFGQKLKSMGPIAGAQYAKAFGVSYTEAIKAADAKEVTMDATTPEESAMKELKDMAEATRSITDKISRVFNVVSGLFMKLGPGIMTAVALVSGIIKKRVRSLSTMLADSIRNGVTEGVEKAKTKIKEGESIVKSIFDTSDIKDTRAQIEEINNSFRNGFNDTLITVEGLKSKVSSVLDPLRMMNTASGGINAAIASNAKDNAQKQYNNRYAQLIAINKLIASGNYTEAQGNKLLKQRQKIENAMSSLEKTKLVTKTATALKEEKISEEVKKQKKQREENLKNLLREKKELDEMLKTAHGTTARDAIKAMKNENIGKLRTANEELNKEIDRKTIAEELGLGDNKPEANAKFGIGGIKNLAKSGAASIFTKLGTTKDKDGNIVMPVSVDEKGKERVDRKKVAAGMAKNAGSGLLKGLSGLSKMVGPMMILSVVMQLLQKPITDIKNKLVDKLTPIMEKLDKPVAMISNLLIAVAGPILDAIVTLVSSLLPMLMPVLEIATRIMVEIVGVVGKVVSVVLKLIAVLTRNKEMAASADAMWNLRQTMLESIEASKDNTGALEDNTEGEQKAGKITAGYNGELVKTQAVMNSSSGSPTNSDSSNITINKTEEEKSNERAWQNSVREISEGIKKLLEKYDTFNSNLSDINSKISNLSS